MKSRQRILFPLLAAAIGAGLGLPAAAATEEGKLVVWINGDKGYDGLQEVGDRFTADTGIPVEVAHPDGLTDKFQQAAASGNGPDIVIWPHDRLGEWAQSGLLKPVSPSAEVWGRMFDFTWDAVSWDGETYGYPISVESLGLIYNKDMVETPPESFKEIIALDAKLAKESKEAILWDYGTPYFSWPLLAANGGYAFKKTENGYDVTDTGVNNAGALQGAELLQRLIDEGVMPSGVDYSVMDSRFNKGEVALMINGPWAWSNLEKSGIDFGVALLPKVGEERAKPMVGVLTAMISSASSNDLLATEFIENYLLTEAGLKTVNADVPLGAVAHKAYMRKLSQNPNIAATMANARLGAPMPNVPEMGAFWSAMEPALKNITSGRQDAEAALDAAAKRIVN
ncbi:maltooligosaccharide-binding protein [Modicisalibacter muralis]|uniref:Maltodextrin-binding protein n=1 Tax=Modicisalibacter muralis TaxID=119000 RepID=A0A1G9RW60_9GAMM|nr:maltose/maltodextrin ABC transporter substrate-binding protein MalE [Halomonas muralis]SDM27257.1 maltooligosaccharide-binding protein [Halomonas muralis]